MYEKKLPFDIDCGIRIAMEVIGGKWKSCILFELSDGPKCPSEIHRLFPEANSRVINQQLKELEQYGIIEKKIFAELPPHSEYSITSVGRTLIPVVKKLEEWGDYFRPVMKKILESQSTEGRGYGIPLLPKGRFISFRFSLIHAHTGRILR